MILMYNVNDNENINDNIINEIMIMKIIILMK